MWAALFVLQNNLRALLHLPFPTAGMRTTRARILFQNRTPASLSGVMKTDPAFDSVLKFKVTANLSTEIGPCVH